MVDFQSVIIIFYAFAQKILLLFLKIIIVYKPNLLIFNSIPKIVQEETKETKPYLGLS